MSAPAPGSTPMMMPTMLPRTCGQGYSRVSFHMPLRIDPNLRRGIFGGSGSVMPRITSESANTPTSAGITSMPPSRSVKPKVKRCAPAGFSMPMQETSRPSSMLAIAFTGLERATMVAHISPRHASQKYSKVEKLSAISASGGASAISESVPMMPPIAENQTQMPSASSGWPLRVIA